MRNLWAIFKKEIRLYFVSPIAYVVAGIFLIIMGYFFYSLLGFFHGACIQATGYAHMQERLNINEWVVRPFFYNMTIAMLLLLPLLTMRLFAEEKRQGTFELLFTSPLGNLELILGKFAACFSVFAGMVALTAFYHVFLGVIGNPDVAPIITSYLGVLLMGAAFIAFGELVSTLTQNQVVAAALGFGGVMLFYVIGWLEHQASGLSKHVFRILSLINHMDDFSKGIISTEHIVFYFSFIFLWLFLTGISLESIRWRD